MTSTSPSVKKLEVGLSVKINAPETRFHECYGIILDMNSDLRLKDGPIAVFFDQEVPDHEFYDRDLLAVWTTKKPTPQNYKDCPRVMCFREEELEVVDLEPLEILIKRKFGENWCSAQGFDFPLKPNTHACQLESCSSGILATHTTLVNVWGCIQVVYTCEPCHKRWHGARTDNIELKKPLPGAPPKA